MSSYAEQSSLNKIQTKLTKYLSSLEDGKARKIDYSNKAEQIKEYGWTREDYSNYVFNPQSFEELADIKPRIIFVALKAELPKPFDPDNPIHLYQTTDFWNKMIIHTSSIHTKDKRPGRQIKYFLIDDTSKKILGILSISSDLLSIKNRDDYLNLYPLDLRKQNIHYLFNITTCVGVQPLSYNTCLGKLLARSPFSREVQDEIKRRYGFYSLGFTTFSIYGKSIQYERVKELKYLGLTKGSFFIIPEDLFQEIKDFIKTYRPTYYNDIKLNPRAKQKMIMTMIEIAGYKIQDFYHKIQRGIYFGYTDPIAKDLIVSQTLKEQIGEFTPSNLTNIGDMYQQWLSRWARRRLTNLKSQHRFKSKVSWSVLDVIEKQRKYNQTHKDKQIAEIGKAEYLEKERERKKKYQEPKCEKWWKTPDGLAKIRELKLSGLTNKAILEELQNINGLTIDILKKIKV